MNREKPIKLQNISQYVVPDAIHLHTSKGWDSCAEMGQIKSWAADTN